ncbi:MAG: hypothetical protein WED00_03770 [Aquisalimonadaceae bacterium]
MDAWRRFHYVGRANDVLKINGCWVSPGQIEDVLKEHPMIADCAVIPVTDSYDLTRPKAFVVTAGAVADPAALWADLKAFARQRLGAHQYPHLFELIDQLPRTASGKLQRALLA